MTGWSATATIVVAAVLAVGARGSVGRVVASPDLTLNRAAGSVAVAILLHGPGALPDHVAGGILNLGFVSGSGHRLVAARLVKPGLRLDLLHGLVTGPVPELSPNLALQLGSSVVLDLSPLLELHLPSGAIVGTIRVRSWTVPATGCHSYGCAAEHQSCRDAHHC